jgi:hypothetical protein
MMRDRRRAPDGAAYAFDVASGNPLASADAKRIQPHEIAINHRERVVVVLKRRVRAVAPFRKAPTRVRRRFAAPRGHSGGVRCVALSADSRLLASGGLDGEVRLWRLPGPTLLQARTSGDDVPGSLHFDGQHLPDIAYRHVRVASATGARSGPWLSLPQPVAFAQLVAGNKTLVAASGTQLHVIDADTMQPRRPPIDLPANPMRSAITDDVAVLAFGTNSGSGFSERLIATT